MRERERERERERGFISSDITNTKDYCDFTALYLQKFTELFVFYAYF